MTNKEIAIELVRLSGQCNNNAAGSILVTAAGALIEGGEAVDLLCEICGRFSMSRIEVQLSRTLEAIQQSETDLKSDKKGSI